MKKPPLLAPYPTSFGHDSRGWWVTLRIHGVLQGMRWIPAGKFTMGAPVSEPGSSSFERPRHKVAIKQGFWMFDTPCTQELWRAVMRSNPSRFQSPNRPVEQMGFDAVQIFMERVNASMPGLEFRLPSEAAWEYACRAGTKTALYNGPIEILGQHNAPALDPIAWYGGNSGAGYTQENGVDCKGWRDKQYPHEWAGTHPVMCKAPNAWGLYDMLGNVWEWCEDDWSYTHEYALPHGESWVSNPLDRDGKAGKVIKGGSWRTDACFVRAASRFRDSERDGADFLGFRCAVKPRAF